MKNISEAKLLRLADLNRTEFWCESSKWMPGTEIVHCNDTVFINSASDFPACNLAFNMAEESDERPADFLARTKDFFNQRKSTFSLLLRGHADQSIIQYCKDKKIFLMAEAPGMALDEPIKGKSLPSGARLRWVEDEKGVNDFTEVVAEAFHDIGLPVEISRSYFSRPERVINPYTILAVAYLKGEPAGAAMAMFSHGIGGIYWVGATKKVRGMGLGEYCTREVGNAAFDLGARKVILQASKFGEPVYRKMGYREITRYPWFICSSK
jgi:ribosomal protein S18 acetylase RimI-like enzyme